MPVVAASMDAHKRSYWLRCGQRARITAWKHRRRQRQRASTGSTSSRSIGDCYTCRHFGERVGVAALCACPGGKHVRSRRRAVARSGSASREVMTTADRAGHPTLRSWNNFLVMGDLRRRGNLRRPISRAIPLPTLTMDKRSQRSAFGPHV
jgi:hypothetical protein